MALNALTEQSLIRAIGASPNARVDGTQIYNVLNQMTAATASTAPSFANGITVTSGGITVTSGSLTLTSGNAVLTSGNLTLTSGNAVLTSGNLTMSAGVVSITPTAATSTTITVVGASLTTGKGIDISDLNALTTGTGVNIVSNSADTSTRSIVKIVQDHASATGATALTVQQDQSGAAIAITGLTTIGIDFTALTSTDVLFNCTAGTGCTAAPQTNAAAGFINIKVGGTAQWLPFYNAT